MAGLLLGIHRHIDPSTIDVAWSEYDYQLINNPPVAQRADAIYYFRVSIDADNDGVICTGDLTQDYDKTPFFTVDDIPSETVEFHLRPAAQEQCQMFLILLAQSLKCAARKGGLSPTETWQGAANIANDRDVTDFATFYQALCSCLAVVINRSR